MCEEIEPFTLQFPFMHRKSADDKTGYEVIIPQHSLVITFPPSIEGCNQVSLNRPWPTLTSFFTACRASCIVLTENKAVKVTTQTLMDNRHSDDLWTSANC